MRRNALKRLPTHHNTKHPPHPGQACRSARKRELRCARREQVAAEAARLGISVLEYEYQQWRKMKERRNLKTLVDQWRSKTRMHQRSLV